MRGKTRTGILTMNDRPFFIGHVPCQGQLGLVFFLQWKAKYPCGRTVPLFENQDRVTGLSPRRLVPIGQGRGQRVTRCRLKPHRGKDGATCLVAGHMKGSGDVMVLGGNTGP